MAIRLDDFIAGLPEHERKAIDVLVERGRALESLRNSIRMEIGEIEFVVSGMMEDDAATSIQKRLDRINELLDQA